MPTLVAVRQFRGSLFRYDIPLAIGVDKAIPGLIEKTINPDNIEDN